jgi:hypothetical protein
VNDSQGSITIANNILYLVGRSFVLGIIGIVYYTLSWVWNYATSLTNITSPSTTFSSSFCCMVTWLNCLYKLWVTIWFMFVAILLLVYLSYCYEHFFLKIL